MNGDVLWIEHGICCMVARAGNDVEVRAQIGDEPPFIRKAAQSPGDARNDGEYLRVLLDPSRTPAPADRASANPLVLIVEDDSDNLLAYEEMLKLDGFRVASAQTVAEASAKLREIAPSAVLLDHLLPDGSGGAMCSHFRGAAGATLPILMVTGLNPSDVAIGGREGPDAVMSKPCRPDLLTAVLDLLILRGRGDSERRAPARADSDPHAAL